MYSRYIAVCLFVLSVALVSCKKETNEIEPRLIGYWTDDHVDYHFAKNNTFSMTYLHSGVGKDSTNIDSIYGAYNIDTYRYNLIFSAKGYALRTGGQVAKPITLPVWKYSFLSDSVVEYTSNSIVGKIRRFAR